MLFSQQFQEHNRYSRDEKLIKEGRKAEVKVEREEGCMDAHDYEGGFLFAGDCGLHGCA